MQHLLKFLLLLSASGLVTAQNIQLHYDFTDDRDYLTTTVEMFKPDAYGSTFFFIDFNYDVDDVEGVSESYFEIVPDVLKNTYVISRQDFNSVSILDPEGELIFEKELLFSNKLGLQYYNFSAGNELYIFTDFQQDFSYIYDGTGQLVNAQPVESGHEVGLIFSEVNNNYQLYSCYRNQFSVSAFFRK